MRKLSQRGRPGSAPRTTAARGGRPRRRPARRAARRADRRRRTRRAAPRRYEAGARQQLRRFRQGSMLAVGATALLLLLIGGEAGPADAAVGPAESTTVAGAAGAAAVQDTAAAPAADDTAAADPGEAARQATGTLRQLGRDLYTSLPVIFIALGLLLVAAIVAKLVRMGLRAALANWERAEATSALVAILIWLLAIGAALSVITGDARALVGSVGLFGLALSWALQAPIESFTGWLLNSFRSYYRVGDRIAVGEVFGDVARIDFLTTTVFEAGGPDKPVQAAQATGALVTFPNSEILRSNVVNYTRDFPFVWDELTVAVANESDLPLAARVIEETCYELVGQHMEPAAEQYAELLQRAGLAWDVAPRPEVFASPADSWTDLTVRYLVPAREMRRWSSMLLVALNEALAEAGVAGRVFLAYPRNQVQHVPPPAHIWQRFGAPGSGTGAGQGEAGVGGGGT